MATRALRTKANEVSAYGFACGYSESRDTEHGYSVTLWREHGTYHVRIHDRRIAWESFSTLAAARRFFRAYDSRWNPRGPITRVGEEN